MFCMNKSIIIVISILFYIGKYIFTLNDFSDETILLEYVDSDKGMFKIKKSNSIEIRGKLKGVFWINNTSAKKEVEDLINKVTKGTVMYSNINGELEIWYPSVSGKKSLNSDINYIFDDHKSNK